MKLLRNLLIAILMIGISPASMSQNTYSGVTVIQHRTAIQNGLAHAKAPKILKPKLFSGKPHKVPFTADDEEFLEVDDVISGYRRRDINKIEHEEELSEHVRWRLFLARQMALLKHKQLYS